MDRRNEPDTFTSPVIPGGLRTTAMAILPHREVDRALDLALSLDIPFWPQLPHAGYYEDMYVQASEHFPGMVLDPEGNTLHFNTPQFYEGLEALLGHFEEIEYFDISPRFSVVYHKFLEMDLSRYAAVRGQLEGPVSFGLKVLDENGRPLIFNEDVRPVLIDFMARRVNAQLKRLKERNPRAFMFIDEPGSAVYFQQRLRVHRYNGPGRLQKLFRPDRTAPGDPFVRKSGLGFFAQAGYGNSLFRRLP